MSQKESNLAEAHHMAMTQGEQLGGTHVVWLQTDFGLSIKVVAVVYKCLQ